MFEMMLPDTYRFPVKVPSWLMTLPAMTLPLVSRTLDAMMTFAGGHGTGAAATYRGGPFAMLSHIFLLLSHK